MTQVQVGDIPDVTILDVKRFGDQRGSFCEVYQVGRVRDAGIDAEFVQDNYSHSVPRGTLRGLHFQSPPFAQAKLVTVLQGCILDVAVDLRRGSSTYGRHVSVELSDENGKQIFVPRGFAHGFLTLTQHCHVMYKVDSVYAPRHDFGCLWNDPDLGIVWPIPDDQIILSDKDQKQPRFAELAAYF